MPDAQIEKDRIADIYRNIALFYDLWAWLTERKARDRCLELAAIQNGEDVLVNNYMFDLLPQQDFLTVLEEFKRVLRPGGRLAMVNMTKGERWYNGIWERIYRINPALLGGCRGVTLLPQIEICGFRQTRREYVSQLTFPSEIVYGVVEYSTA